MILLLFQINLDSPRVLSTCFGMFLPGLVRHPGYEDHHQNQQAESQEEAGMVHKGDHEFRTQVELVSSLKSETITFSQVIMHISNHQFTQFTLYTLFCYYLRFPNKLPKTYHNTGIPTHSTVPSPCLPSQGRTSKVLWRTARNLATSAW